MRLAAALVRAWVAIYTWALSDDERRARRDEIESDLWESSHGDPAARATALAVVGRLVRGVPDDLGWRWERASAQSLVLVFGSALVAIATIALMVWAGSAQTLPQPMPLKGGMRFDRPPAPPPPPPPPCPPAGAGYAAPGSCTPFRAPLR